MTLTAEQIKTMARVLGADLCGIAPLYRFDEAPTGFRPQDIFPETRSVIVFAKRFPEGALCIAGPVPYTAATETILREVYRIACELALRLQDEGVAAVPIPSEPYEYWDADQQEGKGILSLRHAGHLAGLGVFGKNKLLANDLYGNRITLGALLVDAVLEGDPVASYVLCKAMCSLCIDNCPGKALGGAKVEQKLCRWHSEGKTAKGDSLYTCHLCRTICPVGKGMLRSRA